MPKSFKKYITGLYYLFVLICGKIPSHFLRKQLYRLLGLRIGEHSTIYGGAEIRHVHRVKIGDNSIIGHSAILDGRGGLEIGNNVNFSSGVWIWTVQHDKDDPYFGIKSGKVIIEDYAWIACRAIILPDVTIGKGAVVCAGAVVTKNVEPYSIVAGIPAKKIGERTSNLLYNLGDFGYIPFY
ncbi:MAG: acyltransferase [Deltaproteobacteria bacterium]|nr:acyltransferase [Deltaproteobacteria bacterium]